jgi:hypothetical protein
MFRMWFTMIITIQMTSECLLPVGVLLLDSGEPHGGLPYPDPNTMRRSNINLRRNLPPLTQFVRSSFSECALIWLQVRYTRTTQSTHTVCSHCEICVVGNETRIRNLIMSFLETIVFCISVQPNSVQSELEI